MAGLFKKKDIGYYVKSEAVIIQEREVILFFKVSLPGLLVLIVLTS